MISEKHRPRPQRFPCASTTVAVIQCLKKRNDVVNLRSRKGRRVPGMAVKRRLDIDIGVVFGRQIIELEHPAVAVAWIPSLWVGIAFGIEFQYLLQGVEDAVVEKRPAQ
jgi:hypothetical protein